MILSHYEILPALPILPEIRPETALECASDVRKRRVRRRLDASGASAASGRKSPAIESGDTMHSDRIRHPGLRAKITSAQQAALLVQDGMTVGMSGFTRAVDCKSVPAELARRAEHDARDVRRSELHAEALTPRARGNRASEQSPRASRPN